MAATYEPIATTTLGSAAASYVFSSIPSTYTDLVCVVSGSIASTTDNSIYFRLNGDSSALYSTTRVSGDGSSAASYRDSGATGSFFGFIGSTVIATNILQVMNYANTTTFKTVLSRGNNTAANTGAFVSLYRSTSAISSLTIYNPSVNLAAGMTLSLYGIKAA